MRMSSSADEGLLEKINALKRERDAIVIAHNFQPLEVQDAADYVGGTLEMLRKGVSSSEKVIVLGGVYFMAEMAAALCPDKTVLIPDLHASCPTGSMLDIGKLREAKAANPGLKVASYIKSTLEGVAESDYCWTSEQAQEMLTKVEGDILFAPNTILGQNLAQWTGRKINLLGGYCPPHVKILAENVKKLKGKHPKAVVIAHPECRSDVVKVADAVLSSSGTVKFVGASKAKEFIVASELGLVHRLSREHPDKQFYPASARALCQKMRLLDLGSIYWSLKEMKYRVNVSGETAAKARAVLENTLRET